MNRRRILESVRRVMNEQIEDFDLIDIEGLLHQAQNQIRGAGRILDRQKNQLQSFGYGAEDARQILAPFREVLSLLAEALLLAGNERGQRSLMRLLKEVERTNDKLRGL